MNDKFKCNRCGDTGRIIDMGLGRNTPPKICPDCQPSSNEDYFEKMAHQFYYCVHDGLNGPYLDLKSAIKIVKQIAADQREANRKAIMQLQDKWNKEHTPTYRDNQFFNDCLWAITTAEIKEA